jgi:hypothetical protein
METGDPPASTFYTVLTGWAFSLFGSSNFLARFWPALSGVLLILFPALISRPNRPHLIGRTSALILSFGLALAPGLVVVSRQADGPMPALAYSLLTVGLLYSRLPLLAGITGALALLCGPTAVHGILMIGLTWSIASWFLKPPFRDQAEKDITNSPPEAIPQPVFPGKIDYRWLFGALVTTLLLVGSDFFRHPLGIASWVDTLPLTLQSWFSPSGIPALRLLAGLILFQPVAVLFGFIGAVRGLFFLPEAGESLRQRFCTRLFLVWIAIGLLLLLVNPSRQMSDLIWIIPPFLALAAGELRRYLPQGKVNPITLVHAATLVILLGLFWFSLAAASRMQPGELERTGRFIVMLGILALGGLTTVLIWLGWSWSIARTGLVWGLTIGLALHSISMLWGASYLRANQPQELWGSIPATAETTLFEQTVRDLSWRNTGRPESIDIISTVKYPSLRWILRNFTQVRFVDSLTQGVQPGFSPAFLGDQLPSILITHQDQETPALAASYRGQDFTWRRSPGWLGALPQDLSSWLTFRRAPILPDNIILWARADLFPGGVLAIPAPIEPLPENDSALPGNPAELSDPFSPP